MAWASVTPLPATKQEIMAVATVTFVDGGGGPSLPGAVTSFLRGTDTYTQWTPEMRVTPAGAIQMRSQDVVDWTSDDATVTGGVAYTVRVWYSYPTNTLQAAVYFDGSDSPIADSGPVTPHYALLGSLTKYERDPAYVSAVTLSTESEFPDVPPVELINPRKHLRRGISVDVVRATLVVGTLNGVGFDPGTSVDVVSNETPNRVITAPSLLAVYGSGVLPQDQIVVDDVLYEVDGHPKKYRNPFSGRQHGEVITLKLVEG